MSIHIWMEITGNGCILKQDGVMLTSPASCGLVSLEGTETTQGFLGFHFGGFFGAWLTRESLVKLRAGREAEWGCGLVTYVGKPYWKVDDILDIWALHFPWLSLWLVWSSVGTGHPNDSTTCQWLLLRQKLNLVYPFGTTSYLLWSPSVDTRHLLPATLKCWLSTASEVIALYLRAGPRASSWAGSPSTDAFRKLFIHLFGFLFCFLLSIHVLLDERILMRNVLWWKYRARVQKYLDSTGESLDWAFDEVKKYIQSTMGRLLLHKINLCQSCFK